MSVDPLINVAGTALMSSASQIVSRIGNSLDFPAWLNMGREADGPSMESPCVQPLQSRFSFRVPPQEKMDGPVSPESSAASASGAGSDAEILERFNGLLRRRMQIAGIEPDLPVRLISDMFGDLAEVEGHPQADAIRQLVLRDTQLLDAFRELVVRFNRRYRTQENTSAWQLNPLAAASKPDPLDFSKNPLLPVVHFQLGTTEMDVLVSA